MVIMMHAVLGMLRHWRLLKYLPLRGDTYHEREQLCCLEAGFKVVGWSRSRVLAEHMLDLLHVLSAAKEDGGPLVNAVRLQVEHVPHTIKGQPSSRCRQICHRKALSCIAWAPRHVSRRRAPAIPCALLLNSAAR